MNTNMIRIAGVAGLLYLGSLSGCADDDDSTRRSMVTDRLEQKFAALDERIDELGARVQGHDVEASFHQALAELEEQRVALRQRLENLGDASEDAWDRVKAEISETCDEVSDKVEELGEELDAELENDP